MNLEGLIREGRELEDWCSEIKATEFENGGILSTMPDTTEECNKDRVVSTGLSSVEACSLVQ